MELYDILLISSGVILAVVVSYLYKFFKTHDIDIQVVDQFARDMEAYLAEEKKRRTTTKSKTTSTKKST